MMSAMPRSWGLVKLGDLTLPVERKDPRSLFGDTFHYIDISAVGNVSKRVVGDTALKVDEAPSRARQVVYPGDVLVSTVRPGLNAVATVPAHLTDTIASTGFCVLRPRSDMLLPSYLFHFVTTDPFAQVLVSRQKGGAYPAVTDDDVRSVSIPLPPLGEQQRIVEILQEAEEIRRLRAEAEAKTAELIPAMFFQSFGDEADRFQNRPLRELVYEFRYGTSQSSGDTGATTLRIPNILGDRISFDDLVNVNESEESVERLQLKTGDMLFVRTNGNPEYIGRCCVFDEEDAVRETGPGRPVIFASYLIRARLRSNHIRPWFLHAYLRSPLGRARVLKQARTAAGQYNINIEGLGAIQVPVPPIDLQDRFLLAATEAQQIREFVRRSGAQMAALSRTLFARAFSGQLTAAWRDSYQELLAHEAQDRDAALKQAGATISRLRRPTMQDEIDAMLRDRTDGIYSELNREQRLLLREIQRMAGGVPYARYFSAQQLSDYLREGPLHRNPQAVEGHLAVLAARGLVVPVSREEQTEDTGEFVFGNAYRLPLDDYEPREGEEGEPRVGDHARLRELERLAAQLEKERALP
ncbi:MAG: restriction endonuclease subunit S [Deltaproteobacteria bacterium]|nr:restriction endonuclease subunit S [Deltaproteobacteria bacterium]